MKITILMGSPRKNGNTNQLLEPFIKQLTQDGNTVNTLWLYNMNIKGCTACRSCQKDWTVCQCAINDDMSIIFNEVLGCDILVLATPIYSWYCTAPMKATLDRLVYGMNKYYGDKKGPSLWANKGLALIATCGYSPDKGADLWEAGIKRYAKHSRLNYLGMICHRHINYSTPFMNEEKEVSAISFAKEITR